MSDILHEAEPLCNLPHTGGHFEGRYLDISKIVRSLVEEMTREARYMDRLETAFLDAYFEQLEWKEYSESGEGKKSEEELRQMARDALAKIRAGTGTFRIDPPERTVNARESTETHMLTKEQRAALDFAIDVIQWNADHCNDIGKNQRLNYQICVLRSLLSLPPAWEATEERKRAIELCSELLEVLLEDNPANEKEGYLEDLPVLRAMLEEVTK